jgi:hypothetical protein
MKTLLLILGSSFFIPAFESSAATFFTPPFPQSVSEAPVIVRGKIGNTKTEWGKDADDVPRLYTYYDLQTSESLKGDIPSGTLSIRELGGVKEGVEMHVTGTAQFSPGEEVVVFLKTKNAEGTYDLHGMMMSKFSIKTDSNGTEYLDGPAIASDSTASTWTVEGVRSEILKQKQNGVRPKDQSAPGKTATTLSANRPTDRNLASSTQPLIPSWFIITLSILALTIVIERLLRKRLTLWLRK